MTHEELLSLRLVSKYFKDEATRCLANMDDFFVTINERIGIPKGLIVNPYSTVRNRFISAHQDLINFVNWQEHSKNTSNKLKWDFRNVSIYLNSSIGANIRLSKQKYKEMMNAWSLLANEVKNLQLRYIANRDELDFESYDDDAFRVGTFQSDIVFRNLTTLSYSHPWPSSYEYYVNLPEKIVALAPKLENLDLERVSPAAVYGCLDNVNVSTLKSLRFTRIDNQRFPDKMLSGEIKLEKLAIDGREFFAGDTGIINKILRVHKSCLREISLTECGAVMLCDTKFPNLIKLDLNEDLHGFISKSRDVLHNVMFPSLKSLGLNFLPDMSLFFEWCAPIPTISELTIFEFKSSFFQGPANSILQQVAWLFPNIQYLEIGVKCPEIIKVAASLPILKELVVHSTYHSYENIFDLDKTLLATNRHGIRRIREDWTSNFELGFGVGSSPHLQELCSLICQLQSKTTIIQVLSLLLAWYLFYTFK